MRTEKGSWAFKAEFYVAGGLYSFLNAAHTRIIAVGAGFMFFII